ncbi:MAG: hypothetical protein ACRDMJ_10825 [Solirubrobacteraceae bacterium]
MTSTLRSQITIRPGYADDELALARVAALDSAAVPPGPLLVAEVDGELRAALSLSDRSVVADPFHRTAELVALLRTHAELGVSPVRRPRRLRPRLQATLARG